jgi:hypothetical protein
MNTRSIALLAAATIACAPISVLADPAPPAITAVYDSQCQAFLAKDYDAFGKTFSADYAGTMLDGKQQNHDQLIANLKAMPAGLSPAHCSFTYGTATQTGLVVTVDETQTVSGTYAAGGKTVGFVQLSHSSDTWSLAGGTPVQTASKELGNATIIDGKVAEQNGAITIPSTP